MAASETVPDRWQLGTGGRKPVAFGGTSVGFSEACAVSVLFYSNFPVHSQDGSEIWSPQKEAFLVSSEGTGDHSLPPTSL